MSTEKNNICLLCEDIIEPFDEGIKKTAACLISALQRKRNVSVFGRGISSRVGRCYRTNRMLLSYALISDIRKNNPDAIVYIPAASLTLGAFLRAKIISLSIGRPIAIIGLQIREYSSWEKYCLKLLMPDLVLSQSVMSDNFYRQLNFRTAIIRSGIDLELFKPVGENQKLSLRRKYHLPSDVKILLHVGHLKESRGIKDLYKINPDSGHLLIVASTSTAQDAPLKDELNMMGITLFDEVIPAIEEVYQLADIYVFPTRSRSSAMEFPLSVLEAMACGLPVLTTRYGGLIDYFQDDHYFKYYDNVQEAEAFAQDILQSKNQDSNINRLKVTPFGWANVADDLLEALDQL
jgi:glycosyltransferase involved in cell wall biosynthesis